MMRPEVRQTHVYVKSQTLTASRELIATVGGTNKPSKAFSPHQSRNQQHLSADWFDYTRGVCRAGSDQNSDLLPFGGEKNGLLVTDMDEAVRAAKATGADVLVASIR